MVGPHASCTDCCIVLCWSYLAAGGGGCSCMLLLHSVLTRAELALTFVPCVLPFAPCTYCVSLLSTGATIPLAQVVVVTSCNLQLIHTLAQILHLHCVLVVCGGIYIMHKEHSGLKLRNCSIIILTCRTSYCIGRRLENQTKCTNVTYGHFSSAVTYIFGHCLVYSSLTILFFIFSLCRELASLQYTNNHYIYYSSTVLSDIRDRSLMYCLQIQEGETCKHNTIHLCSRIDLSWCTMPQCI